MGKEAKIMKKITAIMMVPLIVSFFVICTLAWSEEVSPPLLQIPAPPEWKWLVNDQQVSHLYFTTEGLDNQKFDFKVFVPGLQIQHKWVGQQLFSEFRPIGGRIIGEVGRPGLPGFSRLVAVPEGAQLEIAVEEGKEVVLNDILLYPVQPSYDLETGPNSFTMDYELYKNDTDYPVDLVKVRYDRIRGCKVACIYVTTARYNPMKQELSCYPNMQVRISFQGGSETYIALERRSRFFEETYGEILGNYSITQMDAADLIHVGTLPWRCDLLIITPVVFEEHVRELARWKEEKGIITRVATLEDIAAAQGGMTADDIRDYIQDVYESTNLSYVLLVGDVEFIPVHYRSIHPTQQCPNCYRPLLLGNG